MLVDVSDEESNLVDDESESSMVTDSSAKSGTFEFT